MTNSNLEMTDQNDSGVVERAVVQPSNDYEKNNMTPLRQHVAGERKPSPRFSYMDRIYDRSWGMSDERQYRSGSSGKQ